MRLRSTELARHLQGGVQGFYVISGDEILLVNECLDQLRAACRRNGCEERLVHVIERGAGFDRIQQDAAARSLFSSRRLMEIRLPSGKPGALGNRVLADLAAAGSADLVVVVICARLAREAASAPWVRAAEKQGVWVDVWPVAAAQLSGWIMARAAAAGLRMTNEAARLIAERTEGNLLAAQQEIDKLLLADDGAEIDADKVMHAVSRGTRYDVFKLAQAVGERDARRAIHILSGLRGEGAEPPLVLWALGREVQGRGGGNRYSPGSGSRAARPAGAAQLARWSTQLAQIDATIKGRRSGDPWSEFALLALDLCGRQALRFPTMAMSGSPCSP
ncbi:MAG: DNA polymerase III subunit delta [Steroidobacteraceae bacterium]